jgi:hypothetical protein
MEIRSKIRSSSERKAVITCEMTFHQFLLPDNSSEARHRATRRILRTPTCSHQLLNHLCITRLTCSSPYFSDEDKTQQTDTLEARAPRPERAWLRLNLLTRLRALPFTSEQTGSTSTSPQRRLSLIFLECPEYLE